MFEKVNLGIIGTGCISDTYLRCLQHYKISNPVACADLDMDAARAKAEEFGIHAMSVDEILAEPDIAIILDLTPPKAHFNVGKMILEAGKHLHSEKPITTELEQARELMQIAEEKKLRIACAPDTILGGSFQTLRKKVDEGAIGKVVNGLAFFMGAGPERWHPNPFFFYTPGGGPMLDIGPYLITALVALLGPVKYVSATCGNALNERIAGHEKLQGQSIPVSTPTHFSGSLEFAEGQIITLVSSFDVFTGSDFSLQLHGTEGRVHIGGDGLNSFGGQLKIQQRDEEDWSPLPLCFNRTERDLRGLAAIDLAYAIQSDRPHRCSGELAMHVLEIMLAFSKSSESKQHIRIQSSCERPQAMPEGLPDDELA